MKFPLTDASDFQEHEAHSGPITKFRISYDDQYLFSTSDDGCVYVFKVADKDEHTIKRDKGVVFSDEVSYIFILRRADLSNSGVDSHHEIGSGRKNSTHVRTSTKPGRA